MYAINAPRVRLAIAAYQSGSTRGRISKANLLRVDLPVAPFPEQHRIVDATESYVTRLDAAVATLERVKGKLKRYHASVLKAAVEGRLVPTEAELARREGRTYEPASVLLERILTERRRWQDIRGRAKYDDPIAPDMTDLPKLPEGWCWASPDGLAALEEYSLGIGPFGSNLKVSDYCDEGVPLIFVRNIRAESFDTSKTKFISLGKAQDLAPHIARGGDVLITKMGEPPGDACLYPLGSPDAVITADCIRWRLHPSLEAKGYFIAALLSSLVRAQIVRIARGVAQKKVSLARFKTIAIPLPPLNEQVRIAAEVERLLSIVNEAMVEVRRQAARCSRLRQAILKWAFEGKLVDQDPTDEPASVLLERIKAERHKVAREASDRRRQGRKVKSV
jgi:type I restriction enzyme S subunit